MNPSEKPRPDAALRAKLDALYAESREITARFTASRTGEAWHPFIAARYEKVEAGLFELYQPGLRILEWGSAIGTIAIMADLLGFDAHGIEFDPELVAIARDLAERFDSSARFAAGSFLPKGYLWTSAAGDSRLGTIAQGASAYPALGYLLRDFDLVFGYPWSGEEPIMHDLMRRYGGPDARLILHGAHDVEVYTQGQDAG